MSFKGNSRAIRVQLLKKHGARCCYCGRKTIMTNSGQCEQRHYNTTVEHMYHKFDIRRFLVRNQKEYMRISCYGCNQKMDRKVKADLYSGPYELKEKDFNGLIVNLAKEGKWESELLCKIF